MAMASLPASSRRFLDHLEPSRQQRDLLAALCEADADASTETRRCSDDNHSLARRCPDILLVLLVTPDDDNRGRPYKIAIRGW
jgi:hypothetical protein